MSKIGGPNTAKRRIQIRRYIQEKQTKNKCYSDPFDNTAKEEKNVDLNPKLKKISIKKKYQLDSEQESESSDEILTGKINLDDADRFIASLKLPKKKSQNKIIKKEQTKCEQVRAPKLIMPVDLEAFKKESEKLQKMIEADSQDKDEEDDNII